MLSEQKRWAYQAVTPILNSNLDTAHLFKTRILRLNQLCWHDSTL